MTTGSFKYSSELYTLSFGAVYGLLVNPEYPHFDRLTKILAGIGIEYTVLPNRRTVNRPCLNVSMYYLVEHDKYINYLYELAFFLKDFGVEYISVCDPYRFPLDAKKLNYKFYIGDCLGNTIHISELFRLRPDDFSVWFVSKFFNKTYDEIYGFDRGSSGYDWEKDAIDSAYEGDSSNLWNTH